MKILFHFAVMAWVASCACAGLCWSAELPERDINARDFVFEGVRFGCTIDELRKQYPDAVRLPDGAKTVWFTTPADEKLNAVRYQVKFQRDKNWKTPGAFTETTFLFVDGKMAEFSGSCMFSNKEAFERFYERWKGLLGRPTEADTTGDPIRHAWRFPTVSREFQFGASELAAVAAFVGRDTTAIKALNARR